MSTSACSKFHYSVHNFFYKRKKNSPFKQPITVQLNPKGLTPNRSTEKLKIFLQPQVVSYSKPQDPQGSTKFKPEEPKKTKKTFADALIVLSERKKIVGRSSEVDKKSSPKPGHSSTGPSKVNFKLQISESITKAIVSPYEMWKISNGVKGKVFVIAGNYPDVRKALLQRGWIENEDQESPFFDLKWSRNARIPVNLMDWQVYNHFPRNFELSVKWQLYENLKKTDRSNFYYLHFFPRSFKLDSKGFDEFFEYYKAIYTISLLKNYLAKPTGYPPEKILVAQIVCKRFILEIEKENYKNNRTSSLVMNIEWKILTSTDLLEIKTSFSRLMLSPPPDLYSTTSSLLSSLQEKDPQFSLNGTKNIWIVKAGRKSRGRDISLFTNIDLLKLFTSSSSCWVVQKYIENPLIICNKKFDIRQWVLVSCADPLTVWIYKQCYLRFSIEDYNDEEISNPYVHLTNNSISKMNRKFEEADIEGCMWSLQKFQEYLVKETGNDLWNAAIFPGIKRIVKNSLVNIGNLGRSNSFELFGYDFMIDEQMKPWLLEINSSPAMDYSTSVTEMLVKEVLEDAVKVVVDYPNGVSDTGAFELCYKFKSFFSN